MGEALDRCGAGTRATLDAVVSDDRAESAVNTNQGSPDAKPTDSPWKSRSAVLVLVLVTVLGFGADIGSKWLAFEYVADRPQVIVREDVLASRDLSRLLSPHEPRTVVSGLLEFSLVLNPGAVFGMGAGKRVVFITFTLGALGFGLWMFGAWTRRGDRSAHVAIALLLAGGLGNLYDRIRFACVRDFIHPLPGIKLPFGLRNPLDGSDEVWPYVSNVADLLLLVGIGMLMVFLWRGGRHAHVEQDARADDRADTDVANT
jgi:signal peptidase II